MDKLFYNGHDIDIDLDLEKLVNPFIEEEKSRAEFIENFKTSLRTEYEDIKFQFKVEKEPTVVIFTSPGKEIKIEFPIDMFESFVTVEETDEGATIITINDIELQKKTK